MRPAAIRGTDEGEAVPEQIHSKVEVLERTDTALCLRGPSETFWMPDPVPRPTWFQMARGYSDHMPEKYACPGFVAVEPGEVVLDCGAFVGGFAPGAARVAGQVWAVEPAPVSFD